MTPAGRAPSPAKLAQVDIKALPAQTERWLEAQRPMLPAPAATLIDRIGLRLDTLSPQLAAVSNDSAEAQEVRRLIGEQLPAFVRDYERVPDTLRRVERNGRTPDAQLVDGLRLIEQEIADMTGRLAQTDLDSLSTRGRRDCVGYDEALADAMKRSRRPKIGDRIEAPTMATVDGEMVTMYGRGVDIFRVHDGKITDHWDASPPAPIRVKAHNPAVTERMERTLAGEDIPPGPPAAMAPKPD